MAGMKITGKNFQKEVMQSEQPVLLDFWAPWCGPCRMLSSVMEELAEEYEGKIKIGKVNVDEETELASAFRVMSIPYLVTVKNGKIVNTAVGYKTKAQLEKMLK